MIFRGRKKQDRAAEKKISDPVVGNPLWSLGLKFIDTSPAVMDRVIERALEKIANFCGADRCYIYFFKDKNSQIVLSHHFSRKDVTAKIPRHEKVESDDFSWLVNQLLGNETVFIASKSDIPESANTVKVIMDVEKSSSMLLCPFQIDETIRGFVGLDIVTDDGSFGETDRETLQHFSSIIGRAINRRDEGRAAIMIEQKFKNLFLEIDDVVFIATPKGKFLEINKAGARLLGYPSTKELMEIDIARDLFVDSSKRNSYKKVLEKKGHIKDYELELKRKDGRKIYVLETSTVLRNERDEIIAYQGILHDVTKRRMLEKQLLQAQKLESIGLLAGGLAHDFNNILTTISGYAELMRMDFGPEAPHRKDVDHILKGSRRAEELISKLLAFSRKQVMEPKVIEINKVIKDLYSMLCRLVAEDIRFDLKINTNVRPIKADKTQIQQILVNLVVNAGHAVKERKRKKVITIRTDEVEAPEEFLLTQEDTNETHCVLISVEDNGSGMDKSTTQKIFEPFYSTKKEGEGTGLGLATIYGIVRQNKGTIEVESEPGIGSIFNIYWPVTDTTMPTDTAIETEIKFRHGSGNILVVEDDDPVRSFITNALKSFGYEIFEAENGSEALQKIIEEDLLQKLDLIITDMVMPEMNGEELAAQVYQLNKDIPILMCSGYTNSQIFTKKSFQKNGYYFLQKPFSVKKLDEMVRTILSAPSTAD